MGKLAELKPREKCSTYCPVAKRGVEVTKWQAGNEYVIVCQEPWLKRDVFVPPRNRYEKGSRMDVREPCGYDRRCEVMRNIFLDEVGDKKEQRMLEKDLTDLLENTDMNRQIRSLMLSARGSMYHGDYNMLIYRLEVAVDAAPRKIRDAVNSISAKMRQLYKLKHPTDSKAINPKM